MVTLGDREKPRDGDVEDLRDWCGEMWASSYLPRIRNIIYVTLASVSTVAVVVMIFIANYKVGASEHATRNEVEKVEQDLKYELQAVKKELQSDIDDLNNLHQEGFERMEDKMDDMMKILLQHDRNGGG